MAFVENRLIAITRLIGAADRKPAPGGKVFTGSRASLDRLVFGVEAALAVLLGLLAAMIFWRLAAPLPSVSEQAWASGAASSSSPIKRERGNPFGVAAALPASSGQQAEVALEDTRLNLKLRGVYLEETVSSAVIELADGRQKRFAVGEDLGGGVILEAVYAETAAIRRNGVLEAVRLINRNATRIPSGGSGLAAGTELPVQSADFSRIVRVAPEVRNGSYNFVLLPGIDADAFDRAGLAEGDIIREINGATLRTDATSLAQALASVENQQNLTVTVERDGALLTLDIDLQAIAQGDDQ